MRLRRDTAQSAGARPKNLRPKKWAHEHTRETDLSMAGLLPAYKEISGKGRELMSLMSWWWFAWFICVGSMLCQRRRPWRVKKHREKVANWWIWWVGDDLLDLSASAQCCASVVDPGTTEITSSEYTAVAGGTFVLAQLYRWLRWTLK